jgi:hypothetical protein
MTLKNAVIVALIFTLLGACSAQTGSDPTLIRLKKVPLDFQEIPLTQVLGKIGALADHDFVLFGLELLLENGQEPLVSVHIDSGASLRQALIQITQSVPGYDFEVAGPHLINIFPREARSDPDDLLNMRISGLHIENTSPSNFLSNPPRYIPELKAVIIHGNPHQCSIGPGLSDNAPGVTIQMGTSTIRQALNTVSELSISMAERTEGVAFGWLYSREKSPSPKAPEHAWRVFEVWQPPRIARHE